MPPIVFLHGWRRSQEDFAALCASFAAQGCRTLTFDFPGVGGAPEPPAAWSVGEYADFTRAALKKEGLGRVIIVAHSFGTRVAVVLAATSPELVAGLVLIGGPLIRRLTLKRRLLMVAAFLWRLASWLPGAAPLEARLSAWLGRYSSMDVFAVSGVMRDVLKRVVRVDLRAYLKNITAPVLLVYGERDTVTPLHVERRALTLLPNARLHIVRDAGHMVVLEKPGEVADAVNRFIKDLIRRDNADTQKTPR